MRNHLEHFSKSENNIIKTWQLKQNKRFLKMTFNLGLNKPVECEKKRHTNLTSESREQEGNDPPALAEFVPEKLSHPVPIHQHWSQRWARLPLALSTS